MIETFGPEFLITVEPFIGFVHRLRAQFAGDDAAFLVAGDEAGLGEHVEMLHHRRQRHRQRRGKLAHRQARLLAQARDQRPPRRIGERGKGAVEDGR